MTAKDDKPMPWEEVATELTEAEAKQQLARILAMGALQAARRGKHSEEGESNGQRTEM